MVTATRKRRQPAKKGPPKRWIINGKMFREEDMPPGVKHPNPSNADYYAPVDEKLLKSIRTPHMVNKRTGKADLKDGIPLDAVLSFTDRGIVLKDMYGLATKLPFKSRKKDRWGDKLRVMRGAVVGSEQKIYYRDIIETPDEKHPDWKTLRIPHGLLVEPLWRDWRGGKRSIPVGREDEFESSIYWNPHVNGSMTWTEKMK